ncbi:MAG: ABC transporter permease [Planctomycetes bacterium]|nr:ABC transporter permease [Planctomycetota bacterium]
MSKTMLVAVREYRASVSSKAFLISAIAMPILMGGAMAVQAFLKDKVDTTDKQIAILDHSNQLAQLVKAAAEQYKKTIYKEGDGTRTKVKPEFIIETVTREDYEFPPESTLKLLEEKRLKLNDEERLKLLDEERLKLFEPVRSQLSARVRKKEILAYIEIKPDVLSAKPSKDSIAYYSNTPTYDDFRRWVQGELTKEIQRLRCEEFENFDEQDLIQITQPIEILHKNTEAEDVDAKASFLLPMGLMMLIFLAVMVGATPLMQAVLEEKMARISEVLLGSVSPFQLMFGKLLGTVCVSMTIVTLYLVGAFFALKIAGYGSFFPSVEILMWLYLYLVLAVFMFGALFSAVGAAVTDMREAQSAMMPVMIIAMSPMFVWFNVVKEPNSNLSVALSLFPPMTPMLMVMRQAIPPGIPTWQPILGIFLVLLTSIACVFAASRIFRVGILMQGKGASVRQMIRWVFRG